MSSSKKYFSKYDIFMWSSCSILIIIFFLIFDRENYLSLFASITGVTSLIFNAKGNPFGQFLMIIFSIVYGIISYSFCYYGEMITYIGMTMPMSVIALVSWLKNPFNGNKIEVKVNNNITKQENRFMWIMTVMVTVLFYFILSYFHTANILPSTLSVTTSFLAVYLTYKRNPYYAIAYAANDVILITLWILASLSDTRYISVAICFFTFFANDIYGFLCWKKIEKKQKKLIKLNIYE